MRKILILAVLATFISFGCSWSFAHEGVTGADGCHASHEGYTSHHWHSDDSTGEIGGGCIELNGRLVQLNHGQTQRIVCDELRIRFLWFLGRSQELRAVDMANEAVWQGCW